MSRRIPSHRVVLPGRPAAAPLYERLPSRRADIRFYQSPVWRLLRNQYLQLHPLCEDCNRLGRLTPATEVHHKIDRKRIPELALDPDNLEACCVSCHNAKRRKTP